MAEEVVDIVHRIAFQVADEQLVGVQREVKDQLSLIDKLTRRSIQYGQVFKANLNNENGMRQKAVALLKENKAELDKVSRSLENTVLHNKEWNRALEREIGLINTVEYRLKVLETQRRKATSPQEISRYNRLIQQEQTRLRSFNPPAPRQPAGGGGGILRSLGGASSLAGPLLAGLGVAGLTSQIFDITSKFEKYNTILRTTFQSNQQAAESFKMIKDFAAATPYSVDELTASYIKLVNRGFLPTKEELTNLGDLAASQGKSFDQLTEALLDAQTGEFERLKEFGIKARTTGDTVTLAFKGIEKQVKKTDQEGLRNAIISFGKLQGVAGGMANVAQGLDGKMSNLGDSFDALKASIGERGKDIFSGLIDSAGSLLNSLTDLVEVPLEEKLRDEQQEVNSLIIGIASLNEGNQSRADLLTQLNQKYPELLKNIDLETLSNSQLLEMLNGINQGYERRIQLASIASQKESVEQKIANNGRKLGRQISDENFQAALKATGQLDQFLQSAGDFQQQLAIVQAAQKKIADSDADKFGGLGEKLTFQADLTAIEKTLRDQVTLLPKLRSQNEYIAKQEAALIDQNRKRYEQLVAKIKEAAGLDENGRVKVDFQLNKALSFAEVGEFNQLRSQFEPKAVTPKATTAAAAKKGGKKKTFAEAEQEIREDFAADLRKAAIRDEVQDFIRASQDIEEDRKKRLEKIEKLEKEYKRRATDLRETSDKITALELSRDLEDYETRRLKLIADNEAKITSLRQDAALQRAQLLKRTFSNETEALRRELAKQQADLGADRLAALERIQQDAEKGLYGNLQRDAGGVNLPRDQDGNIVIRFVKVDGKGQPLKDGNGNFIEDAQALEAFNKQVQATNEYYDLLGINQETRTNQTLLEIAQRYYQQAQQDLADYLEAENTILAEQNTEQIRIATAAYLSGEISYKAYQKRLTDIQKQENRERTQNEISNLAGAGYDGAGGVRPEDIRAGRIGEINRTLSRGSFETTDDKGNKVFTPLDEQRRNDLIKERLTLEQKLLELLRLQNAERAEDKNEGEEKRKQGLLEVVNAYTLISDAAAQAAQSVVSSLEQETEAEIRIRESRVDRARKIADRGHAEELEAEEERLEGLQARQRQYAQMQLGINAALTLSNSIAAVARAAAEGGIFAPATIAAVIAALAAGYTAVRSFTADLPAFAEGVIAFRGKGTGTSDSNPVRISNGESIITAQGTQQNREVLEAINKGKRFEIVQSGSVQMLIPRDTSALPLTPPAPDPKQQTFNKQVLDKFSEMSAAIHNLQPSSFTFDRRGIAAAVREVFNEEGRKWKV